MLYQKDEDRNIKNTLYSGIRKLKKISDSGELDAEILLRSVLHKDKAFLYAHPEYVLTKNEERAFEKLLSRRKKYEPIAYIIGKKEFYGREFFVNKNVLIPRPLTEGLVEEALKEPSDIYLDVGTGSGCIIITLVKEILSDSNNTKKKIQFFATDISKKALVVAKKNAKFNGVEKYIRFVHANLLPPKINVAFVGLRHASTLPYDHHRPSLTIIANLPYLSPKKYKTLSKDIRWFEPKLALVAEDHGTYYYKKLLREIQKKNFQEKFSNIRCIFEMEPTIASFLPQREALHQFLLPTEE